MAINLVRQALEVALNQLTPALPTQWENVAGFTLPPDGAPYQRAWLLPADPINPEINANHIEHGLFQINLYYKLGIGSRDPMERAELIRQHFLRGATFTRNGISVTVTATPRIAPAIQDADRYVVPVRVPYRSFIRP